MGVVLLLALLGAALLVVVATGGYLLNRSVDKEEAIEAARAWGRLAALPASAQDIQVETEGSMFTRAFRVTFRAPVGDVEQWVEVSPGVRESVIEVVDQRTTKYVIEPGEGAAYAEILVTMLDGETAQVEVYAYWS
jgi:hypothetical protein